MGAHLPSGSIVLVWKVSHIYPTSSTSVDEVFHWVIQKTPVQRVAERNPAPKLSNMHGQVWYFIHPFCEGPELLPKLHWSAMQNNSPNIKAGWELSGGMLSNVYQRCTVWNPSRWPVGAYRQGIHTLTRPEKNSLLLSKAKEGNTLKLRRDPMNKTWGIVSLYSRYNIYISPDSPNKSIHFTNYITVHEVWDWELSIMYQILNFLENFQATLTLSKNYDHDDIPSCDSKPLRSFNGFSALIDMPSKRAWHEAWPRITSPCSRNVRFQYWFTYLEEFYSSYIGVDRYPFGSPHNPYSYCNRTKLPTTLPESLKLT